MEQQFKIRKTMSVFWYFRC